MSDASWRGEINKLVILAAGTGAILPRLVTQNPPGGQGEAVLASGRGCLLSDDADVVVIPTHGVRWASSVYGPLVLAKRCSQDVETRGR